jgi:aryl-alcohol dehydrogenase-like predicted oxidoreductase
VSEQSKYSLIERSIELEVLPACRHYGVGVLPWSPLAGGLLAGVLPVPVKGRRSGDWVQKALADHLPAIQAWEELCSELGESPAHVALAWVIHQKGITAPIIGPRTMEQLEGALRSLDIQLDEEVLERIDEIFPGYKTAPEHYAW